MIKVELQQQDNTILFTGKDGKTIYKTAMVNDPDLTKRLYEAVIFILGASNLVFCGIGENTCRENRRGAGGKNAMSFGMGKSSAKIYVKSSKVSVLVM